MDSIKEKLHPITVWCIYSRYFSKDFKEHCQKFNIISQKINWRLARNRISVLLSDVEIIECARIANKYLDFLNPVSVNLYDLPKKHIEADKINKIKATPEIEALREEAKNLHERGLYYHREQVIKKIKELEEKITLQYSNW